MRNVRPVGPAVAVLSSALLFLWPACVNHYPLLFSDTGAFLAQVPRPDLGWDKPWIYGPFLLALHGQTTLWLPAIGQCLLLSWMIWLAGCVLGATPVRHLLACATLAALSAAPWFATLLMPDIFAPIAVLAMFVLGFGPGRVSRLALGFAAGLGSLAIAVHLAHLPLAAACIAAIWLVRWRLSWRPMLPLAVALCAVLVMNAVGEQEYGISPFGQIFLLARLVGDGPARTTIAERCPEAGWRLCNWNGRLGGDSDQFLWDPNGPVWADNSGPSYLKDEASAIVRATLLAHPGAVVRTAMLNTVAELARVDLGDTLTPEHLDTTVWQAIEAWFPPEEQDRYATALQPRGMLLAVAAPWVTIQVPLLLAGAIGTLVVVIRGPGTHRAFATVVLIALLANAFSTGALSARHDRYQARIAWLLLLPPLYAARRATSSGDMRTSFS